MCYIQTAEYYSAVKRNEAGTHATTQMSLEDLRSVKHARHKRMDTAWDHVCEVPRVGKFLKTGSTTEVTGREGRGDI